jgi:hypothetical protein
VKSEFIEKYVHIQGDSYGFINILTSGRFRSPKALDNTILGHTSKIGKNYHIGFFTISKCHSSLNYSTLHPIINVIIEANNYCYRENIGIIKFALVSFSQQSLTVCFNVKYFHLSPVLKRW